MIFKHSFSRRAERKLQVYNTYTFKEYRFRFLCEALKKDFRTTSSLRYLDVSGETTLNWILMCDIVNWIVWRMI
jgi:hypothetical protein